MARGFPPEPRIANLGGDRKRMGGELLPAADTAAAVGAVADASKAAAATAVMGSIAPDKIVATLSGICSVGSLRTVCTGFRCEGDDHASDKDHSTQQAEADREFVHCSLQFQSFQSS